MTSALRWRGFSPKADKNTDGVRDCNSDSQNFTSRPLRPRSERERTETAARDAAGRSVDIAKCVGYLYDR